MNKRISIEGMSCGHCVNHVKAALAEISGITIVEVSLADKTALIEASGDVTDEEIKAAIDDVGYEVVGIEVI